MEEKNTGFLNSKKLLLSLVILTLFVSLSCASASPEDIHIGDMIFLTAQNTDGCHWVVSECNGANFMGEDNHVSVSYFHFMATRDHGFVEIELVNSNGEVIDSQFISWDERYWDDH